MENNANQVELIDRSNFENGAQRERTKQMKYKKTHSFIIFLKKHPFISMGIAGLASVVVVAVFCIFLYKIDNDDNLKNNESKSLLIGAFNIRSLSSTKISNKKIANQIVDILKRYDVILVQEVRDNSGKAIPKLLDHLNKRQEHKYDVVVSENIGTKKYFEKYAYFYRHKYVDVTRTYQFNDTEFDHFAREPFVVEFSYLSVKYKSTKTIVLAGLHTQPSKTLQELQDLPKAINKIIDDLQIKGLILMGDLNADCSYLSNKAEKSLEIFKLPGYNVLISGRTDTTVSKTTHCAYDRIVVCGSELIDNKVAINASVYLFDREMNISDESEAKDISDHYPVEFRLL